MRARLFPALVVGVFRCEAAGFLSRIFPGNAILKPQISLPRSIMAIAMSSEQSGGDKNDLNYRYVDLKYPSVRVDLSHEDNSKYPRWQPFEVTLDYDESTDTPHDMHFEGVGKCVEILVDGVKCSEHEETPELPEDIKIVFEHNTLSLSALGDCCSRSWFETFEGESFKSLIGAEIIDIRYCEQDLEQSGADWGDYERNTVNVFIVRNPDGTTRPFVLMLRNSSNGYYRGYIENKWLYDTLLNKSTRKTAHLTVVLGLPGCGKTTYVRNNYDTSKVMFFDDYLNYDYLSKESGVAVALLRGQQVVLADPRLCDPKIYRKEIIEKLTTHLLDAKTQLTIVAFSNKPCQSVMNVLKREVTDNHYKKQEKAMKFIRSIVNFEDSYSDLLKTLWNDQELHKKYFEFLRVDTYSD